MPDNELLSNKAVLDPMRLVEIVTTFVTVVPPKKSFGMFNESFDKLDKGILEERLLRTLWKKRKIDDGKNFEFLVALMIQLGFICERKTTSSQDVASTSTELVVKRSFFVPLRLAFKTSSEVKPVPDDSQSISIYYDFKGYLPDVLFPYMIIDFLNKFQKKGVDPILSYNHAELDFDQDHDVTLSLVKFITKEDERKFLLKVTIKRTPACNETSNDEPSSEACKEVLLTIQKSFEPSKDGGRRGIQYERCILCDVCSDTSEKKHILNLEDFQYRKLKCTKTGKSVTMDVSRYKRLFVDETERKRKYSDQDEIGPTGRKRRKPDQDDVGTSSNQGSSSDEDEREGTSLSHPHQQSEDKNTIAGSKTCDNFQDLKAGLSGCFDGERYRWLRFLLFDKLDVGEITNQDFNGHDLLNVLEAKGLILSTNVNLLLEITKLSDIKYAKDLVSKYIRDNVQFRNTDKTKLSFYRKRLFKALKQVDPRALRNVISFYKLRRYSFSNVWDAVLYLEIQQLLADDPDKINRFADRLGTIASNILLGNSEKK
ncbi:uncharacterized protein [Antedon mediterranea]|uniref:uncharacterized protein n=1 Tax=Antedon mediterranea TaxID=105859 RepID=UPI003AF476BE